MNNATTTLRLGSTAIAAILALSSAPAFAQTADPAPAAAPVPITVPPAPAATAPSDSAPAAASPATEAPAPAPMQTTMQPIVHGATSDAASAPASDDSASAANVKAASRHATTRTASASPAKPAQAPAETTPDTSATKTAATEPATQPAVAPVAPIVAPQPAPAPAPVAKAQPVASSNDDTLMLAGAGGLGVILLGGGAFLAMRKRRDDELDEPLAAPIEPAAAEPEPMLLSEEAPAEPVAAPVMAAPVVPAASTEAKLPNGFDISRYGRHVQAAYRGPTEDNPSLSLKHRLRRAAFYDRQEEKALAAGKPVPPVAAPVAAKTGDDRITTHAVKPLDPSQVVYRPKRLAKRPGFSPAFNTARG